MSAVRRSGDDHGCGFRRQLAEEEVRNRAEARAQGLPEPPLYRTAAYQTLPAGQWQRRELAGQPHPEMTQAPYFLGQCHSWAYDSPTVQRAYPMFFKPKATETPGN